MQDWIDVLFCLIPDLIAGILVGILAGLFCARRYGLVGRQKRQITILLTAALTLARYVVFALLILLYVAIVELTGLAE